MALAHLFAGARTCGATTVVDGQSFVFINGKLWAVDNDPNTHAAGGLIPGGATFITIGGKMVIVQGDHAKPDGICPISGGDHCDPVAADGELVDCG